MRHSLFAIPLALTLTAQVALADPAASQQACTCQTVHAQLQHAFDLHNAGQYGAAAKEFLKIAEKLPAVQALAARSLAEEGKLGEAYHLASSAVDAAGKLAVTHFILGLVAERRGLSTQAAAEYREVIKLDPQNAAAHNNLGGIYYLREEFKTARAETEEALRLETSAEGTSIALANLAEFDALEGNAKEAEAKLDQALQADPESAVPYYEMAIFYDAMGRSDAALSMIKNALDIDKHGAVYRASAWVWPELKIQSDALLAEARNDHAEATAQWTALNRIDQAGALHWSALKGRASAHLGKLTSSMPVTMGATLQSRPEELPVTKKLTETPYGPQNPHVLQPNY